MSRYRFINAERGHYPESTLPRTARVCRAARGPRLCKFRKNLDHAALIPLLSIP